MNISAVGPVGAGVSVYAASPYLNGVVRTPDAVTAAQAAAASSAAAAVAKDAAVAAAAQAQAAAIAAPVTPFANPAIAQIAQQTGVTAALATPAPAASPTDSVLKGDSGTLIQSYGAVALIEPRLLFPPIYTQPAVPAIPPVAPVVKVGRAYIRAY
jgi:hypothetical protein